MKSLQLLLGLCLTLSVARAAEGWTDDYTAAMKLAKTQKRLLLLDFTGGTWCPPCVAFGKFVLSTDEFKNYVKDRFVLARVNFPDPIDFPEDKIALARKHVTGDELRFPTIVVFGPDGKKLGQLGYENGSPAKFIAELERIVKK